MDPIDEFDSLYPFTFPSSSIPFPACVDFPFDGFPAEVAAADPSLDCSDESLIAPFVAKTYCLVDDSALDAVISWSENGRSFVVWEPSYLAAIVLPRCFKHDNFSSFVRQLNSYGFRKIDSNKWEFANEFFLRGTKRLLKNIQRRKPPHLQQAASEIEAELEKIRAQKSLIMQGVAEIEQRQQESARYMDALKLKLVESEKCQKAMVSCLAKAVQNPEFIESIMGREEPSRRKVVKPKTRKRVKSGGSGDGNGDLDTWELNDVHLLYE